MLRNSAPGPYSVARSVGRGTLLCLCLLLMTTAFPLSEVIHTHGGGTPQLSDVETGPYRLFVWTQPEPWRAGEVHATVAVTMAADGHADDDEHDRPAVPVEDVDVTVRFLGPNDAEEVVVSASPHASLGAGYYEADALLDDAGEWRVQVDLSGSEGSGSAQFPIDLLPARSFPWLWALGALLLVIVTGLLLWRVRRSQSLEAGRHVAVDLSESEDGKS